MAKQQIDLKAAAKTGAVLFGAWTAALWIFASLGFYTGAAVLMEQFHLFFNLTFIGLITGTMEAVVYGGLCGLAIAWLYNKM